MDTLAVVLREPKRLDLGRVDLVAPGDDDVIVDIEWTGISTGTERLFWSGRMPPFPGMGYPLVPGYESVGRVTAAGPNAQSLIGDHVFVPGARCFTDVHSLFGGAARRLIVPSAKATPIDESLGERAALFALAATAYHCTGGDPSGQPDLIIGHGVLGRLLARIAIGVGAPAPVVWELNPSRRSGADGYTVIDPAQDTSRDYRRICDVSGDSEILDTLVRHLAPGGEIILAGFYSDRLSFAFPMAFMREARMRIAAEWREHDMAGTKALVASGGLSLDGLITHRRDASAAPEAYDTAFSDPSCLKMILDWRACS